MIQETNTLPQTAPEKAPGAPHPRMSLYAAGMILLLITTGTFSFILGQGYSKRMNLPIVTQSEETADIEQVLRDDANTFEITYPKTYVVKNAKTQWTLETGSATSSDNPSKFVSIQTIDPNTIQINHLDGTYTKYDSEKGQCYSYSKIDPEQAPIYMSETIDGYNVCRLSQGDGEFSSSMIVFIYPNKQEALRIMTGTDDGQFQEKASLEDFKVTFLNTH